MKQTQATLTQAELYQPEGNIVVVLGASMGGLLAARVLTDYYEKVILVERDTLPVSAEPRKGVPQARHAHALLARGREILEMLFPNLTQALVCQGAVQGQGRFFSGGGYHHRLKNSLEGLFVSRPLLEAEIRARVLASPKVCLVENGEARGLVANETQTSIVGIRLIRRQKESTEEILPAKLVVDASGRSSHTPLWLKALGYPQPEETWVEVKMGYTTRLYQRQPEHLQGDVFVNVAPTLNHKRAAGMLAQEGNRWIVTLAGYCGDYPPTDEPGFLEFARSLPTPDIYNVIRQARPLSDLVTFKFPANQRRHYEKLSRFPNGLLVFGDALCSFTPIYGQGMSVAALEALALQECLAKGDTHLAQRFFKQASRVVDIPWSITVGNDKRLTQPDKAYLIRFLNWYMDKLQIAARYDATVAFAFQKVANLMAAPPTLLRPSLACRVLWGNRRGRAMDL